MSQINNHYLQKKQNNSNYDENYSLLSQSLDYLQKEEDKINSDIDKFENSLILKEKKLAKLQNSQLNKMNDISQENINQTSKLKFEDKSSYLSQNLNDKMNNDKNNYNKSQFQKQHQNLEQQQQKQQQQVNKQDSNDNNLIQGKKQNDSNEIFTFNQLQDSSPQQKQNGQKPKNEKLKERQIKFAANSIAGINAQKQIKTNQDSFVLQPNLINDNYLHFFGVFDGHGNHGHQVSGLIKQCIVKNLKKQFQKVLSNSNKQPNKYYTPQEIQNIFKSSIQQTSTYLERSTVDTYASGSTFLGILVDFYNNKIYSGNIGDSIALLGQKLNQKTDKMDIQQLIVEHKPSNQSEKQRIIESGGRVHCQKDIFGNPVGPLRVWLSNQDYPGLAMTRSIGDTCGAKAGIISEPEIQQYNIDRLNQNLIIMGSDGLFDYLDNQQAFESIQKLVDDNQIISAAEKLQNEAIEQWKKR
ncbi:Protein phosphatase 2C (PP2C)-like domain [Pseudocohnilembus persalinus]|uniref:Protein phosphatase 2C (PP2C)-like domain n=1 Tax=Pseudocohnilembus persalinus TaxID=266149 RepID=A0A0V0QVV4_PSEPJ|nr:Protein phosphatase 2C (PP2C)-like domain [Pseudocohnilembus persalinus]|eukprot:KRX06350.1 Protein phosphatase 2C (PP2C)-like domain [Pseudocohnilembus persalinus]